MRYWVVLAVSLVALALAAAALGLEVAARIDDASVIPVRTVSTSDTTTTTWPAGPPLALPAGFNPTKLRPYERVRVKVKHVTGSYTPAYALQTVALIRQGFARFGPVVAERAVRVAGCETGSTYDPRATNGDHDGLFELSERYQRARAERLGFAWAQMLEPVPNIVVAADLYAEQGWAPWSCRP